MDLGEHPDKRPSARPVRHSGDERWDRFELDVTDETGKHMGAIVFAMIRGENLRAYGAREVKLAARWD